MIISHLLYPMSYPRRVVIGPGGPITIFEQRNTKPQSGPRQPMSPVFLARNDLSGPARGVFARLGKDKEDPNPHLAEAVIAWHLGEVGAADDAFEKRGDPRRQREPLERATESHQVLLKKLRDAFEAGSQLSTIATA